jgi:hypothetical protein
MSHPITLCLNTATGESTAGGVPLSAPSPLMCLRQYFHDRPKTLPYFPAAFGIPNILAIPPCERVCTRPTPAQPTAGRVILDGVELSRAGSNAFADSGLRRKVDAGEEGIAHW